MSEAASKGRWRRQKNCAGRARPVPRAGTVRQHARPRSQCRARAEYRRAPRVRTHGSNSSRARRATRRLAAASSTHALLRDWLQSRAPRAEVHRLDDLDLPPERTPARHVVHSFDLGNHGDGTGGPRQAVADCLNATFGGRLHMHWGDSRVTVPAVPPLGCSVMFVDGAHAGKIPEHDMRNMKLHAAEHHDAQAHGRHLNRCFPARAWYDPIMAPQAAWDLMKAEGRSLRLAPI